jgi:hypothetical protein
MSASPYICAHCVVSGTHLWWTELQWLYRWCFNRRLQWIHIGEWEIWWTHSCIILRKQIKKQHVILLKVYNKQLKRGGWAVLMRN